MKWFNIYFKKPFKCVLNEHSNKHIHYPPKWEVPWLSSYIKLTHHIVYFKLGHLLYLLYFNKADINIYLQIYFYNNVHLIIKMVISR